MKYCTIILFLLATTLSNAQNINIGVELAPCFTLNPSRLHKPNINATASIGDETVSLQVSVNTTQLETGVYFGSKAFQFGVAARADIDEKIQLTPVMAIRYNYYAKHGFILQVGTKIELPLLNERVYCFTPIFIGIQKQITKNNKGQ